MKHVSKMKIFPTSKRSYELSLPEKSLYLLCLSAVWLVSKLPFCVLYALSDLFYPVVYRVIGYRREIVRKNLSLSFPDADKAKLERMEKDFYHWMCDEVVETVKQLSLSEGEMKKHITYHGIEHVTYLLRKRKNVALYLGHYANWEWMTSIGLHLPKDICQCQVYHELENRTFDSIMLRLRESMGTENINMSNILRRVVQCRRENKLMVCGFISDQVPIYPNVHYYTDFLNHKDTLVITGTERLAKQCGFGCLYLDIKRVRRGYYDVDIIPLSEDSKAIPDWDITERYYRLLEKSILREPAIWLWSHNRWKRDLHGFLQWCEYMKVDPKERMKG